MVKQSAFDNIQAVLGALRCSACGGRGMKDDGEPGDTYYREWPCEDCLQTGFTAGRVPKLTVEVT